MIVYQVIMGREEFDPFEGMTTAYVHKTLKGAWKELGTILDKMFEEYRSGEISKIHDIDVNPTGRHVVVYYERSGFPGIYMTSSLYIQVQVVTL